MDNRNIKLSRFKMVCHNKVDIGFFMNRPVTCRESMHILRDILGISICCVEDFEDKDEYTNLWLKGDTDDDTIMEYAQDCSDEPIGIWNAFKIAEYLIKKGIV